jgi:hypothetical protein
MSDHQLLYFGEKISERKIRKGQKEKKIIELLPVLKKKKEEFVRNISKQEIIYYIILPK